MEETMLLEDSDFENNVARLKQPRLMSVVTSMALVMAGAAVEPAIASGHDPLLSRNRQTKAPSSRLDLLPAGGRRAIMPGRR